ncbi:MAG: hypothetical protein HY335_09345, partial [Deinococcus sp.]|nr:hypothetical protein [Deinococcus sp.]
LPYLLANLASQNRAGFVQQGLLGEIVRRILGEYGPHPQSFLGHLLFYPRVLLTDFVPWTALLVIPLFRSFRNLFRREPVGEQALAWWLALPLVAYTLIQGKLDSYIFPAWLSLVLFAAQYLRAGVGPGWLRATALLLAGLGVVLLVAAGGALWYLGEPQYLVPLLLLGGSSLVVSGLALGQLRAGRLLGCRDVLLLGVGTGMLLALATNPFNHSPDFVAFEQVALPQLPIVMVQSRRGTVAAGKWLWIVHHLRRPPPPGRDELWVEDYLAQLPSLPPHVLAIDRFAFDEIGSRLRYQLLAQGRKWRLIEVEGPAG